MNNAKFIYTFEDGDGSDRMLLGGKGANLCAMTQIGLDVPPGFVITTAACLAYLEHQRLPDGLMDDVRTPRRRARAQVRQGIRFGDRPAAGLGAVGLGDVDARDDGHDPQSRPQRGDAAGTGRADRQSALRLGRLPALHPALRQDRDGRSRRGLRRGDGGGQAQARRRARRRARPPTRCRSSRRHSSPSTGSTPEHRCRPIRSSSSSARSAAVFQSWNGKRAVDYRRQFRITPAMANGTAVNVCTMVFGNMGDDSATGVGFTRNPATGENVIYGEYLVNAQGEDVVAGIRTPKPIAAMAQEMPGLYRQLLELRGEARGALQGGAGLRVHDRARPALLPADAQRQDERARDGDDVGRDVRGRPDLEGPGARPRSTRCCSSSCSCPRSTPRTRRGSLAQGLAASPGAASGSIVFDADTAEQRGRAGESVILVREETKPEDIHGFFAARGHPDQPRRQDLARRGRRARAWASRACPAATRSRSTCASAR